MYQNQTQENSMNRIIIRRYGECFGGHYFHVYIDKEHFQKFVGHELYPWISDPELIGVIFDKRRLRSAIRACFRRIA